MTDPRLVAALAEALHDIGLGCMRPVNLCPPQWMEEHLNSAAATLPAFLADPRVAEWLAERLHETGIDPTDPFCRKWATAILGREVK